MVRIDPPRNPSPGRTGNSSAGFAVLGIQRPSPNPAAKGTASGHVRTLALASTLPRPFLEERKMWRNEAATVSKSASKSGGKFTKIVDEFWRIVLDFIGVYAILGVF
jgi:hypothetical protein